MEKFEPHFDARAELKNIRHLNDNEKEFSKEERLKLRKERLEDIKKKLADQMMGIAQTNAGLETLVFSGEELSSEKLNAFLEKAISSYKLAPYQIEEYEAVIEKVVERNNLVNRFFTESCEGKTGEEIFEFIFDKKPRGKIIVEKGALSLIIFCDNEDFVCIHSLPDAEIVESSDNTKKLENVGGSALYFDENKAPAKFADFGNSLIIIKGTESDDAKINETIVHENKHIFDNLVFPNETKVIHNKVMEQVALLQENLAKITDEELNSLSAEDAVRLFAIKPIEFQVDAMRRISEATAKNEILAYYKQGVEHGDFYSLFSSSHNGQLYAVIDERTREAYEEHLKTIAGGEQEKAIAIEFYRKMHSREEELYKKHLIDAIHAISRLESVGVSRDDIIGLFEAEPLANWYKIFERIKKSDTYEKKSSLHSLRQYLKTTEDNIESHNEAIAEALQQLEEPSEKNHFYRFWQNYHKQNYATYEDALRFFIESNKKYLGESIVRKSELEQQISELEK